MSHIFVPTGNTFLILNMNIKSIPWKDSHWKRSPLRTYSLPGEHLWGRKCLSVFNSFKSYSLAQKLTQEEKITLNYGCFVLFSWHQVGVLTLNQSLWHYFPSILPTSSPWKMPWSSSVVSRTTGHNISDILISRASIHITCYQIRYFTNVFWQHVTTIHRSLFSM